jgi:phage repressor protein C with HTH and peptisase S24 domain
MVSMPAAVLPWQRVRVSGPSMSPTLRDGDVVVVRHGARIRPGDVVLARFRDLPDRPVLKRVAKHCDDGWWLVSDNSAAGGDSSVHGVADVQARVVFRWRRGSWPRRVR